MQNLRLGKFFWLREFCTSEWAARRGIIIDPPQHVIDNLRRLVVNVLDPLRDELGPMMINSGYRPPLVNQGVGGARTSQHVSGQAADIRANKYPPRVVFDTAVRMHLPVDQAILEFNQWTHLSFGPLHRRDYLIASYSKSGVQYQRFHP